MRLEGEELTLYRTVAWEGSKVIKIHPCILGKQNIPTSNAYRLCLAVAIQGDLVSLQDYMLQVQK